MNRFLNSIINKAARNVQDSETCHKHKGEYLVAFDTASKNFGCERCVYEGRYEDPRFISIVASEIKEDFDTQYVEMIRVFKSKQNGGLSPHALQQSIRS